MIEIINMDVTPEFESKMLKEYIVALSDYASKVKDCEVCKLNKLCRRDFNTCPKGWKWRGVG